MKPDSVYYDERGIAKSVAAGNHREAIGGLWDELGALQFDFLLSQGLSRTDHLLDVGCGAGRLAVRAAPYLDPFHYWGIDISPALLQAALFEVAAIGALERLKPGHLHASAEFEPPPGMERFNIAIAQSLFTHLKLDKLGQCFDALKPRIATGGRFFATFFAAPAGASEWRHERGGVVSYADRDPFHTTPEAVGEMAEAHGWHMTWIGDWEHPRNQQLAVFRPRHA